TLTAAATGLTSATQLETITAAPNAPPRVSAGGPYTIAEGSELTLSPTVTDLDAGDVLTFAWTVGTTGVIDAGGSCSFNGTQNQKNAKVTCDDDSNAGKFTLTLTVDDGHGHTVP